MNKLKLTLMLIFFSFIMNAQECDIIKRDIIRLTNVIKAYEHTNKELKNKNIVFESEQKLDKIDIYQKNKELKELKEKMTTKDGDLKKKNKKLILYKITSVLLTIGIILLLI